MDILRFKPRGYWILDNATGNAIDISGYSIVSTTSTTDRGFSLSSNAAMSTNARKTDGTNNITFAKDLWVRGEELKPVSIAATIFPVVPAAGIKVAVLTPVSNDEGIWIIGTKLYFGTRYLSTGIAQCVYDFEFARRLVILAVHTPNKNSLYVNGELVAEVDITFDQFNDVFNNTVAGQSYSGKSDATAAVLINEVAFFESALNGSAAKTIYNDQTRGYTGNVPATFNGEEITLSTDFRKPLLAYIWKDTADWDHAMQVNCIVDEDLLVPETRNGVSLDAQWITSVNMYNGSTVVNVNEINVDYSGYGATVSISLDGVNWTVANGSLSQSFNPFKKDLYVKIDFAAGIEDAFLDNLYINIYTTNVVNTKGGRAITYIAPTTVLREYPTQQYHAKWGVDVDTGGSVRIANPSNLGTFEVWYKPDANITTALAFPYGAGAYYVNGIAGAATLFSGQWYLVHLVPTAATITSNPLSLTAPGIYGQVALYKTKLTAAQIANIYREYSAPITTTVSDTNALAVTEIATPALIYATDYAVVGGNQ